MNKLISLLIVTLALGGWTAGATAQNITNGYVCEPKNPGGEETRLYFRQQDGVAINLSKTATFPVVCPAVINQYLSSSYGVSIVLINGSTRGQTFNCAMEEYDIHSNKVRQVGTSEFVAAGRSGLIQYGIYSMLADFNYTSVRCILPPGGMVGEVAWF